MKFCSPECKNKWHNHRGSRYRNCRMRVHGTLERNHRILERMLGMGLHSMDLMGLLSQGFIPEYCSACRRIRGHLEYVCYDIRYYISAVRIWGVDRVENVRPLSGVFGDP